MRILETTMSRRRAVATIAAAAATIGTVAVTGGVALANSSGQRYTVYANVNLRSGPGTSNRVILVIPKGATFTLNNQISHGFTNVPYNGQAGWVLASLVHPVASGHEVPAIVGEGTTSANVNLRSGPGTGYAVLRVVKAGSFVGFSNSVQNGFRYVTHNGLGGWMSNQYVQLPSHGPVEERFITTARLNLRAEPSLTARVLVVIPANATVVGLDGGSGQFRKVNYTGTIGWAAHAYLN